ncbi:MAG TPA: acyl-ACP--UDP-N-acetylglucosamine O-acyltransferase [Verrucomicrobiae bacterium]
MIHPTAIIHPNARIAAGVTVGPYSVIDENVVIAEGCEIGPHVYLTGWTELGKQNRIHAGAVIGDLPQDLRFRGEPTKVIVGEDNVIREHVTIHRSNSSAEPTRIGSSCLLMAHCHVGHNSSIGNSVIIANGTLIAGHVMIADRVFISGNCMLHQFVRVGTLALMQGGAGISKDLPPFTIARGNNRVAGLNTIGLRRAGLSSEERLELRRLYHLMFRSGLKFRDAVTRARAQARSQHGNQMVEFLETGRKGFCADVRRSSRTLTDADE